MLFRLDGGWAASAPRRRAQTACRCYSFERREGCNSACPAVSLRRDCVEHGRARGTRRGRHLPWGQTLGMGWPPFGLCLRRAARRPSVRLVASAGTKGGTFPCVCRRRHCADDARHRRTSTTPGMVDRSRVGIRHAVLVRLRVRRPVFWKVVAGHAVTDDIVPPVAVLDGARICTSGCVVRSAPRVPAALTSAAGGNSGSGSHLWRAAPREGRTKGPTPHVWRAAPTSEGGARRPTPLP